MPSPALLGSVDIFAHLAPSDLEQVAERMRERTLTGGEVLYRQGAPADCMAVVVSGAIDLTQTTADDRTVVLQRVGEGETCGDIALFSGEPYVATATAQADTRALLLRKDDFEALLGSHPSIMRSVLAAISRRVTQVNRELVADHDGPSADGTNGRVIAVFSPRGGAGKTTVAVNLALQLAAAQPGRVALLDLDLLFDDAAFLLHVTPAMALASLTETDLARLEKHMLSSLLGVHESQLRVLVAARRPEDGERVTPSLLRASLAALRHQFAVTVVDCGSSLSEPALVPLELADRVVVVCTPDLASVRDVRDCQRIFGQALHLDRQRFTYCFNHPLPTSGLTRAQFESALEQPIAIDIPHSGGPSPVYPAQAAFDRSIDRLARDVLPVTATKPPAAPPGRGGRFRFWHRG